MSMVNVKVACDCQTSYIIIILQVTESASNKRSQVAVLVELGHDYSLSLLLLTALMPLMRTFIEESLCLWKLLHDAQKHVRFVIVQ